MTHSLSTNRKRRLPRFPFWKDEKVGPGLTTARVIRLFIITVMLALVVIGFAVNRVLDLQDSLRQAQTTGRAARIADQKRMDALIKANQLHDDKAIRDLVCFAVADVPAKKSVKADELRAKYRCPPYKVVHTVPLPSTSATPGTVRTIAPLPTSPTAVPLGSPAPSFSPSGSISPAPPVSPSSSPVINLSSIACRLVDPLCK